MHDPNTVAHDIKIPLFWRPKKHGVRPSIRLLTIWHKDPEKDGDENSCDWHGSRMQKHVWDEIEGLPEESKRAIYFIWQMFHRKLRPRPWYKHPKWHVHHWGLQLHLVHQFKRWAWSRCHKCGERFTWRDVAAGRVVGVWGGKGPAWFSNGEKIWHMKCEGCDQAEAAA